MSVSDPLIKELKGHTLLMVESTPNISDENAGLTAFCDCLERILRCGVLANISSFGNFRPPDPWFWLEEMAEPKYQSLFSYQSSLEFAKNCSKVKTNCGRLRLLIRSCLAKRCMHIPVQLLVQCGEVRVYYSDKSIIGDGILVEILLSVLMLTSKLQFKLDLRNSRFLDETWILPRTKYLQFVPCNELGLTLAFVDGKALAISVLPNSIASEEDQIEVGDVLDELNSVPIIPRVQGNLGNVLKKAAGLPVTAYIVKADLKGQIYSPLLPVLTQAGVDINQLQNKITGDCKTGIVEEENNQDGKTSLVTWLGKTGTGSSGDVKKIRKAIESLLKENQEKINIIFDCQDLGVAVFESTTKKILFKHSYMQISSCGCTVNRPNHFAYIAEEPNEEQPEECFMCYIFYSPNPEKVDTLLNSIGQGFKRTHCAV